MRPATFTITRVSEKPRAAFEVQVLSRAGWSAIDCVCAAARALFPSEAAAAAAFREHLAACGREGRGPLARVFPVEHAPL